MACHFCTDANGDVCVPYYGVAPHECFYKIPGASIGESRILPESEWPPNFRIDPENPNGGTYWCAHCGEGNPTLATRSQEEGK